MAKVDVYQEWLANEGYRPTLDKDGDLVFKFEGGTYILFANDDDTMYYRLTFPSFWPIENDEERERARRAIDQTNATIKVAKLYFTDEDNNIWAAIEMLLPEPEMIRDIFDRTIRILKASVNEFRSRMTTGSQN